MNGLLPDSFQHYVFCIYYNQLVTSVEFIKEWWIILNHADSMHHGRVNPIEKTLKRSMTI